MNRHDRYIEFALNVARKGPDQKYRMGCVIVQRGVPVGMGFNNMRKTHTRASSYRHPYIHAELSAMIGVDSSKIKGSTAYVARVRRDDRQGMAKPCEFCEEELRKMGVSKVFYTTDTEKIEEMKM